MSVLSKALLEEVWSLHLSLHMRFHTLIPWISPHVPNFTKDQTHPSPIWVYRLQLGGWGKEKKRTRRVAVFSRMHQLPWRSWRKRRTSFTVRAQQGEKITTVYVAHKHLTTRHILSANSCLNSTKCNPRYVQISWGTYARNFLEMATCTSTVVTPLCLISIHSED